MFIVEHETFYMIREKKWFAIYFILEQMEEALTEAGTVIIVPERDPAPMELIQNPSHSPIAADYKATVFVAAQKVESFINGLLFYKTTDYYIAILIRL